MVMGKTCYYEFEPYAEGRELIVLTHNVSSKFAKAKAAHSLDHALSLATHSLFGFVVEKNCIKNQCR